MHAYMHGAAGVAAPEAPQRRSAISLSERRSVNVWFSAQVLAPFFTGGIIILFYRDQISTARELFFLFVMENNKPFLG